MLQAIQLLIEQFRKGPYPVICSVLIAVCAYMGLHILQDKVRDRETDVLWQKELTQTHRECAEKLAIANAERFMDIRAADERQSRIEESQKKIQAELNRLANKRK